MNLQLHRVLSIGCILILLTIAAACSTTKGQADTDKITALTDELRKVAPSVVMIEYGNPSKKGTGVIVGGSGDSLAYVMTADHVAAGFIDLKCSIKYYTSYIRATNIMYPCELLQRDDGADIALVKVNGVPKGQQLATINKSGKVNFENLVSTIGHPGQQGQWLASKGRITSSVNNDYALEMKVRRGNSGGGVYKGNAIIALVQQTAAGRGEMEASALATKASVFVPVLDGKLDELEKAGLLDRRYKKSWSMPWYGYAAIGGMAVLGGIRASDAISKPKPLPDPLSPER